VRRWIGEETFRPAATRAGVELLDDQAARYGAFTTLSLVGLVEQDWPDRSKPNIFYPVRMLRSLGWPSEKDRRAAAEARFLDLLSSSSVSVSVSTFLLDEDAPVMRSAMLDEIPRAHLSITPATAGNESPTWDSSDAPASARSASWLAMRKERRPADAPEFHGFVGSQTVRTWSVSALETYLGCPFRFFALHVLKLKEEPEDEEVMDPRRQGALVHTVFETFFSEWQAAGQGAITSQNLAEARERFEAIVDRALSGLSNGEAGLERTRLLGSPAAAGLGEAVFRMEAERPVPVVERLLEHTLAGTFSIDTPAGPREVSLRGKADRLDLLEDGTFRLIDYKLGWPPNRSRALQLPIYSVCAEQHLAAYRGRSWKLGEAAYLAFKGPRRVVPLFGSPSDRDEALADAQNRLVETIDAINRGEFPPTPDDVYRCETCTVTAVCRKDYVGDVRS
jgi:ATP-dependent helicase/nuclease subunit B